MRTARTADGSTVAYAAYGDPEGRSVVFLHGTPGSRVLGEVFHDVASERGVRVLAPDRPGYGRSAPSGGLEPTDADRYVEPVLSDAGASEAGVIGFSGGSAHALGLAAARPDLVTTVDVVAGAAPPALATHRPPGIRVVGALAGRTPRLLGAVVGARVWLLDRRPGTSVVAQYTTGDADDVDDEVAGLVERDFREAFARTREGFVTESRLAAEGWGFDLRDVDRQVRLWHGGRDVNVPVEDARRVADRLPNCELTVFDDADHLRTLLRSRSQVLDAHA